MSLKFPISLVGKRASSGGDGPFATSLYDSGENLLVSIETDIPSNWNDNNTPYNATRLEIGTSCTTIGEYAFSSCTNLTGDLVIPDSVTSIGFYAFGNCQFFDGTLTIGNSVTSIGQYAFYYCDGLTGSLTIPDSVTSIGSSAFRSCSNLTGLVIPNSVTSIGSNAFDLCTNLTSIVISESVTSIGSYAFYYCSSAAIYTNCPASSWVGTGACSGITNIYLGPNAVGTGYTNNWQAGFGSGPTVFTWDNYPNPIPN